jgi:hypothetical protein
MLIAGSVSANIITNVVNITSAVGAEKSINFSLTGAEKDRFDFFINPMEYPNFVVSTTFGGDNMSQYSQIAMANGFQALLAGGTDVKAQAIWAGTGMLIGETSFFYGASTDPNGWKNSTGYVGLRYREYSSYYYGWAEFKFVSTEAEKSVTLTRYAYETTANTTLLTPAAIPEPATATMLALSGLVIVGYRRMRKSYGHF